MTQLSKNPAKLIINAAICDTRKVKEENYADYEAILINSDLLVVNEYSKSVLNRLQVSINSDNTIDLTNAGDQADPELKTINGPCTISADTVFAPHTLLKMNGPLTIEKGAEEALKNIEKIVLNGPVTYPRSLGGRLPQISQNGPARVYPDDAVLLPCEYTLDKYFALRAKENTGYYASNRVIASSEADLNTLVQKNVHFLTERIVLHEDQVETGLQLVDEKTELTVIPVGALYLPDDTVITELLVKKAEGNLYIDGDAELDKDADPELLCGQIRKLVVKGKLSLTSAQEEAFRKIPDTQAEELCVLGKTAKHRINDLATYYLDKQTLERYEEGIELTDIAKLTIDPEIPADMIYERLTISDVALIRCGTDQAGPLGAVSTDVAAIRGTNAEDARKNGSRMQTEGLIGGIMNALFGTPAAGEEGDPREEEGEAGAPEQNVRLINADKYVL